jgi:hypothetical protein
VSSLRPPRLIQEDGIIRPYDRQESEGYDLFEVNSVHGHEWDLKILKISGTGVSWVVLKVPDSWISFKGCTWFVE